MKTSIIDEQKYLSPTLQELGDICFELAKKINEGNKLKFDRIIALATAGLTWSKIMADFLDIKKLSSFQIKFYKDIYKMSNKPVIIQSLPIDVSGENILLFDDIADTGETFVVAKEYLTLCGTNNIVTAALFIKDWVKTKPDYYCISTDAWIIVPPEARETIRLLNDKWSKKKVNQKEIVNRLVKIGLPQDQVRYFLNK